MMRPPEARRPTNCPTPEMLAGLVARGRALPHVRDCSDCQAIVDEYRGLERGLWVLRNELFPAPAAPPAGGTSAAGGVRILAAAAVLAVAVLVALTGIRQPVPLGPEVWRGEVRALQARAVPLDGGRVSLRWSPIPGAAVYAVVIRDLDGLVLTSTELGGDCGCEAVISLPSVARGSEALWTVDALTSEAVRVGTAAGTIATGQRR